MISSDKICILFCFLIFSLFSSEIKEEENSYELQDKCYPYLQRIKTKFKAEMEKKYGLICDGEGGQVHEKLKLIHLDFTTMRRASIEETRGLLIKVIDRLLEMINENQHLRPYLCIYPFTVNEVEISLSFDMNCIGDSYTDGSVTHVIQYKNKIIYGAESPLDRPGKDNTYNILKETYEESKKTIAEHPLPYDPKIHQPTPYEAEMELFQLSFADKMLKKWRLYSESFGGRLAKGIDRVGFHFILLGHQTEEEARELLVKVSEELVQDLNANAKLKPYFVHSPITYEDIDMQISFWKSTHLYYQDQSVAEICQEGNKVLYFKVPLNHDPEDEASEDDVSDLPALEESYEEAVKLISQKRVSL